LRGLAAAIDLFGSEYEGDLRHMANTKQESPPVVVD